MNSAASFQPGNYYHVYNRSNNRETLFKRPNHRSIFLDKYSAYISPFVYTHSYALLDNHFHFSIQIKHKEEIMNVVNEIPKKDRTLAMWNVLEIDDSRECNTDVLLINQFKNFLISYVKGINREMNRTGSLFQKKFKRSQFDPSIKFQKIQYYIHHNARLHDIVHQFMDFPFHSFFEIVLGSSSIIDIPKVLEHYNDIDEFKKIHAQDVSKAEYLTFTFESLLVQDKTTSEVDFGSQLRKSFDVKLQ